MKNNAGSKASTQQIAVSVRPKTPNGNEVPCQLQGPDVHRNVLFLDYDQDYDITFTLQPGNGVNNWSAAPFGNQQGSCPPAGQGPTAPCSLQAGGTATSIIVHVDAVPSQPGQRVEQYRLNYNGDLTSDPIIIIGK
jgi:hypothetical protein